MDEEIKEPEQEEIPEQIPTDSKGLTKWKVKQKYKWLTEQELTQCFDLALHDYLTLRYPSQNNRPKVEDFEYDYSNSQWIYARMLDILSRAGGLSVEAYRENNLNFTYGADYMSPQLKLQIMPKASVPK